jgi:hypothetical protein
MTVEGDSEKWRFRDILSPASTSGWARPTAAPTPRLIEALRRFARGEGFDEQPMPGLDSEALDFRAASESFAPLRKLGRRYLETLRLVTEHQSRV